MCRGASRHLHSLRRRHRCASIAQRSGDARSRRGPPAPAGRANPRASDNGNFLSSGPAPENHGDGSLRARACKTPRHRGRCGTARSGGTAMNVTFRNFQRIHLVGIGGSGMSGIAEVLLSSGYAVSGSGLEESIVTRRLKNLWANIQEGHKAESVHGAHVIVISSAVPPENVEVNEAHRLKIP